MEKLIQPILALLLMLPMATAQAKTKQYNIEIVIFEDSSNRYLDSEQWPVIHQPEIELSSETFPRELEPLPDDGSDTLTADKYGIETESGKAEHPEMNGVINITRNVSNVLADHVAKLKRSSRYNVLLHQSWQQIGLDNKDAVSVGVDTSEIENEDIAIFSTAHKPAKTDNKKLKSSIQGSIKLILGRYLHVHTDLHYKRINKLYRPDSPALYSKKFDEFSIKSQRRMRSNELHYIDHPLLGILVIVTPVKPPEPVEENKESDEAKVAPEMKPASDISSQKKPLRNP